MKKLNNAEFDLQKVKFNSKKGLDIKFWEKDNNNNLFGVDSDDAPHSDLIQKLSEFREVFAVSMETLEGWAMARENTRKNDELLKEAIRGYNDEIERYDVSGVVLVGKDKYFGIRITGSRKTESGVVGMTSPTIRFTDENEIDNTNVIELFNQLQNEIYLYIFKNKKAQLDMFTEKDNQEVGGLNNLKIAQ